MSASASTQQDSGSFLSNRWVILCFGILGMIAVANFQYGWTLFVKPLQKHFNVDAALIQITFTVFVLLETWLVPFEGWLVDKFGPRLLVMVGGVCAGLGWVGSGKAESLTSLYLSYALAGIGAGIVYGTAVGIAMKWFPDHRGLAAGLTAAGFGAGSAFTVAPIAKLIDAQGYQAAFIQWGVIQGIVVIFAALFLKAPPPGWLPKTWRTGPAGLQVRKRQSVGDFTALQMAATPHFWLMYVMMVLVATGGLIAVAQLGPIAVDYKVDKVPVSLLGLQMAALTFALSADRLVNGICRPFWGWVSDRIGREMTMGIAFGLQAVAIFVLIQYVDHPRLFVICSAFTFFAWGEIFSLFPALCGDFFGRKHATGNYGFLYTAKGSASVFVPIGSALAAGKAFDFRADILLVIAGVVAFFTIFLAPTVLRIDLGATLKKVLLLVAGVIGGYALVLTVLPKIWTPFSATFVLPKGGWSAVFNVAIAFNIIASLLAFFVLRPLKVPALPEAPAAAPQHAAAPAHGD